MALRTQSGFPSTNEGCQTPSPVTRNVELPNHETDTLRSTTVMTTSDDTSLVKQTTAEIQSTTMSNQTEIEYENGDLSLSWVLVGVLTSVLCLWAIANIICAGVYLRQRRYKVENNPSYAITSPIYNIEEHVYDTPA